MFVGFQIVDECGAAADIGFLQLAGSPVPDDRVEIGECLLEGVVAAGTSQYGVARKPHAAAPGEGSGAAELVGGLHQRHREALPRRGVRAGDAAPRADDQDVDDLVEVRHRRLFSLTHR